MVDHRGDWSRLIEEALSVSSFVVELAALSEDEFPSLVEYLASIPPCPSATSASTARARTAMPEADLVAVLADLPSFVDAVVLHPDLMDDVAAYEPLGQRLVIENMDARKGAGRTADELQPLSTLPEAGLCFDVPHAWSVDPSMKVGNELLDRFTPRLRHLHVSSVSGKCHHAPLTAEHEELFAPLLDRCRDVPWILEAPLRAA